MSESYRHRWYASQGDRPTAGRPESRIAVPDTLEAWSAEEKNCQAAWASDRYPTVYSDEPDITDLAGRRDWHDV